MTFDGPVADKIWLPQYTQFIKDNLTPEMLAFPAPSFYPDWHKLDDKGLRKFWACVIQATSWAECDYNRLQMFREDKQWISKVTGKQNVSEGLLQLSYGDPETDDLFLWEQDKDAFYADYATFTARATTQSTHPARTILNPYRNLLAGIRTFTRLIKSYGNTPPFKELFGKYWSTIRHGLIDSYFRSLMSQPDGPILPDTTSHEPISREKYRHLDPKKLVNKIALEMAIDFFDDRINLIENGTENFTNQNYITICDYSLHSSKLRLSIINMMSGEVEQHAVAHGKNSDSNNSGWATVFSNVNGSECSSLGFVRTGEIYDGTHPHELRLRGLSPTNYNIRSRSVVMHESFYVQDGAAKQGRSFGCLAIQASIAHDLIDKLKNGSLIFCYHPSFHV